MQTSGDQRRESAKLYPRHCERSEAIHLSTCRAMDCFAALAMTGEARHSAVSKGEAYRPGTTSGHGTRTPSPRNRPACLDFRQSDSPLVT